VKITTKDKMPQGVMTAGGAGFIAYHIIDSLNLAKMIAKAQGKGLLSELTDFPQPAPDMTCVMHLMVA
jgi:hypothetical protein